MKQETIDLPARRLTDDEIAVYIARAILDDRQNPNSNLPFQPSVNVLLARLGIAIGSQQEFLQANRSDLERRMAEYCWRQTFLGHLVPEVSGTWGQFHLTERGREFLSEIDPMALSTGGLDRKLQEIGFDEKDAVRHYARLSHECFLAGYHEASIVMLGVASEVLVRRLAEAIDGLALPNMRKRPTLSTVNYDLLWLSDALRHNEKAMKQAMPGADASWMAPLATLLSGTGQAIRLSRNDAGHPTGFKAEQGDALQLLTLFPRFAETASIAIQAIP